MVMLIAGGSLSVGSHDPYCGTLMPSGAVHPFADLVHLLIIRIPNCYWFIASQPYRTRLSVSGSLWDAVC